MVSITSSFKEWWEEFQSLLIWLKLVLSKEHIKLVALTSGGHREEDEGQGQRWGEEKGGSGSSVRCSSILEACCFNLQPGTQPST